MADRTKIEWADRTWSPWEGCTKVSPACDHCYAAARNQRFSRGANWGPGAPRRKTVDWTKPLLWHNRTTRTGRRTSVFPSICDPLDNEVPTEWFVQFLGLIQRTPNIDWLLLTKRIVAWKKRMEAALGVALMSDQHDLAHWIAAWLDGRAPDHVLIGATVVTQEEVDRDVPKLLAVPARLRFISVEPMLERIDISGVLWACCGRTETGAEYMGQREELCCGEPERRDLLDWVICGGESGPHARPSHPDWFRGLRDQCVAAGVPFLFKQWGEWGDEDDLFERADLTTCALHNWGNNQWSPRVGKASAGRQLDGRTWDQFPWEHQPENPQ